MRKFLIILIIFFSLNPVIATEYKYILNERHINKVYEPAKIFFENTKIDVLKEARGVILRFELENPKTEYIKLSEDTIRKICQIEYFLAKIKNFVIIEVHAEIFNKSDQSNLKNWELSTVIANNIENLVYNSGESINRDRIISIGYGEFLPQKNTPYNGGKYNNRVDIIILCNINGD